MPGFYYLFIYFLRYWGLNPGAFYFRATPPALLFILLFFYFVLFFFVVPGIEPRGILPLRYTPSPIFYPLF